MKKGRNHGWTLMDADIPVARHRFLCIRVYPRPSAVRIFGSEAQRKKNVRRARKLLEFALQRGRYRESLTGRVEFGILFLRHNFMQALNNLELHVTHRCNLTCESCSHYSNHGHRGDILIAAADDWMAKWKSRLAPVRFTLLGGEPTLHPQLVEIIHLVRFHWPKTVLKLTTNGFFLSRQERLPQALQDTGCRLAISVHHDDEEYARRIAGVRMLVAEWQQRFTFVCNFYEAHGKWTRRYQGYGEAMEPFADGNPRASWEVCPAKHCRQLHEGRIWKCAPLAYLRLQHEKFSLNSSWEPYLAYKPLEPDCSDEELKAFFALEEESYCRMCPGYARPIKIGNPMHSRARAALTI
jgi:MoaA/NifB/PqqE/SkfB family radical SAM enzyme